MCMHTLSDNEKCTLWGGIKDSHSTCSYVRVKCTLKADLKSTPSKEASSKAYQSIMIRIDRQTLDRSIKIRNLCSQSAPTNRLDNKGD